MSFKWLSLIHIFTDLLHKAYEKLGQIQLCPMITGSGGLTLAKHLGVPFVQEVIACLLYTSLHCHAMRCTKHLNQHQL